MVVVNNSNSIKAIIFDCDGLLLDTETAGYDSWCQIYREFGQTLPLDLWVQCVGASWNKFDAAAHLTDLLRQENTLQKFDPNAVDHEHLRKRKDEIKLAMLSKLELMPGVMQLLARGDELNLPMAVASSSRRPWVENILNSHHIADRFQVVVTGDMVKERKPAPDLFLRAAQELEIAPEFCLVLEDSENGIIAAHTAGCLAIAVPNQITKICNFSKADFVVESLLEVELK